MGNIVSDHCVATLSILVEAKVGEASCYGEEAIDLLVSQRHWRISFMVWSDPGVFLNENTIRICDSVKGLMSI